MIWAGASWKAGVVICGRRIYPGATAYDESNCQASWYLYEDFGLWLED